MELLPCNSLPSVSHLILIPMSCATRQQINKEGTTTGRKKKKGAVLSKQGASHTRCVSGKPDETSNIRRVLGSDSASVTSAFPPLGTVLKKNKNSKCDSKGNNISAAIPPGCSLHGISYIVKHTIFHNSLGNLTFIPLYWFP